MKTQNVYDYMLHSFKAILHLEEIRSMQEKDVYLIASVYDGVIKKVGAFIEDTSLESFLDEAVQAVYDVGVEKSYLGSSIPSQYHLNSDLLPLHKPFFFRGECYKIEEAKSEKGLAYYVVLQYTPKTKNTSYGEYVVMGGITQRWVSYLKRMLAIGGY